MHTSQEERIFIVFNYYFQRLSSSVRKSGRFVASVSSGSKIVLPKATVKMKTITWSKEMTVVLLIQLPNGREVDILFHPLPRHLPDPSRHFGAGEIQDGAAISRRLG